MRVFSITMPQVNQCEATRCVYNFDDTCHARAITVGDGVNAMCDTFFNLESHNTRKEIAGVGACRVSKCKSNSDFECQANSISVGLSSEGARCMTYSTTQ